MKLLACIAFGLLLIIIMDLCFILDRMREQVLLQEQLLTLINSRFPYHNEQGDNNWIGPNVVTNGVVRVEK